MVQALAQITIFVIASLLLPCIVLKMNYYVLLQILEIKFFWFIYKYK